MKVVYGMAPSYIIDLIHTKTNTRYLLRYNEGVLLKHPSGKNEKVIWWQILQYGCAHFMESSSC